MTVRYKPHQTYFKNHKHIAKQQYVTKKQYASQHKQQGVALIFVLLIVAVLVALAATMTERMSTQFYRASNLLNHQQAYWYSMGVEALAQVAIEETYKENSKVINLNQAWAMKDARYPLDNGDAIGSIRDMQACFNLNALNGLPVATNPSVRPYLLKVLAYMLEDAGIESYQAEVIADSAKEFVDSDDTVNTQSGVENNTYEGFKPAYSAPNGMIADGTELRAVNQVSAQAMRSLRGVVCAIPASKLMVNVNTIQPHQALLLSGLFQPGLSLSDAQKVIEDRPYDGWSSVQDFLAEPEISRVASNIQSQATPFLGVTSQYFELDAQITVDESRVRLRSLLYSSDNKTTQIIRRRFGGISERVSDNKTEQ
ncbi:type II secretion system minor pseudopilin GspK [Vibrio sp. S11_S32]|uniref:type II secretion system minor pseudopilin GspK n=1 Tax=Vibrio sp. S11_S32 TaxID=2720225 RepID=UPI0016810C90|nr:type II secretion system minor pseudopilin GspK [Vibrio sp. S11_S32]MBD1576008.1 type II secretion system minor pseudopilin GspK [Vibrio sp. S11_S32]